jgi:hypothetical protein
MAADLKKPKSWIKVKLFGITNLTELCPPKLRWQWCRRSSHLALRSPRGVLWQFKLHRGCWLKRL